MFARAAAHPVANSLSTDVYRLMPNYTDVNSFAERGFSVLRFNFRGVGRSQGAFDHGQGELSDAASALDWAQSINPEARAC